MKLLEQLSFLGYDVRIDSGNIKLSYKGEGEPDKNIVMPLFAELKANKNDVIKMLQKTETVAPTVEESCKCGRRATTFDFGEIENGEFGCIFYCNRCNPHNLGSNVQNSIPDEVLRDVYLEITNRINDLYIEGTIRYVREQHKELDGEINSADGRVNEVWQKCNDGTSSIEGFKSALDSYEKLYLKAIELYKKEKHL